MAKTYPDTPDPRGSFESIEAGTGFMPKFDAGGLLPAIVTEDGTGQVLMFAHMNGEAMQRTLATGEVHFWSRGRKKIWKKGEESGNILKVVEILTDCDQDVLWIKATVAGRGVTCHTGAKSCFYRRLVPGQGTADVQHLEFVAAQNPIQGK